MASSSTSTMAQAVESLTAVTRDISREMVEFVERALASEAAERSDKIACFSKKQRQAYDAVVVDRKNIVVTGQAGTGKTHLYSSIYAALVLQGLEVSRTATTGVAAVNIEGTTLHTFMSLGLGTLMIDELVEKVEDNEDLLETLTECDALLIDEISMADPIYFFKCDQVLRRVRHCNRPFGGIQLVVFGDFLQLPPVAVDDSRNNCDDDAILPSQRKRLKPAAAAAAAASSKSVATPFATPFAMQQSSAVRNKVEFVFEPKAWNQMFDETIELDIIFRQTDNIFRGLLNRCREGKPTPNDLAILQSRVGAKVDNPVELRAHKKDVATLNDEHLASIKDEPEVLFYSSHGYKWRDPEKEGTRLSRYQESIIKQLSKDCPAPPLLKLKVGARVMLVWNEDVSKGLANGSQGVVVGIDYVANPCFVGDTRTFPVPRVKFDRTGLVHQVKRHKFTAQDRQHGEAYVIRIPLKLSKALTIHKGQGLQWPEVRIRVDETNFAYGQAYVGLSRCESLEGLCLTNFDPVAIQAHPKALMYYARLREKQRIASLSAPAAAAAAATAATTKPALQR